MRRVLCSILASLALLLLAGAVAAPPKPPTRDVSIKDLKFNPATLTVKVGDTVRWINNDDVDHVIAAADGSFVSGNLRTGQTFQYKFTKPGTFDYGCRLRPRMQGRIVVAK